MLIVFTLLQPVRLTKVFYKALLSYHFLKEKMTQSLLSYVDKFGRPQERALKFHELLSE